jgi:GT2 family glycosyltransferase
MKDFVAVITINYNKTDYTIACVESILKSNHKNYSIVIVDNGSNPMEYQKLLTIEDEKIRIERIENNCGYVGGINHGLKSALKFNADFYLVMNNDTLIDKNAMSELLITSHKSNHNCIVSGKVYNMDDPKTLQYIGQWCKSKNKFEYTSYVKNSKEIDTGQFDKDMEMDMLDDIFWLIPKEVFSKIGYYSHYFYLYGEQNDYSLRAKNEGIKLIYSYKSKIWHYSHLTVNDNAKAHQKIYYWQAYAEFLLKYLHLSGKQFLFLYISKSIKLIYLGLGYIILLRILKFRQNHLPKILAQFYFTLWLFHKKENKGFNPYFK